MIFGKHMTKITKMALMSEFQSAFGKNYSKNNNEEICVLRSHGWIVSKLPPKAEVLGGSEYGNYDIYKIGDQILCSQLHPEFTEKFEEFHEIIPMH